MAGRGCEAHQEGWEQLGGPAKWREAILENREWLDGGPGSSKALRVVRERSGDSSVPMGRFSDPSRTTHRAFR